MPSSNCCFLTCIQISQEIGQVVWYYHLFKNFTQFVVIHTFIDFGIINKAEIDVFLELSCFFDDPVEVGNLFSGSSAFSKSSLNISKFSVEAWLGEFWALLYKHVKWVQLCSSLSIFWHCLSLGLKWKLTFSSPMATAEFSKFAGILSAVLSQYHLLGFEIAQMEFCHLQELCSQWCFLRPTWLHIPEYLALDEWSHHRDHLGHKDVFYIVLLCILGTSSKYFCFC